MAVNLGGWWRRKREDLALQQRESLFIPSPVEGKGSKEERQLINKVIDDRLAKAKHCTDEGVKAGLKAATVACAASSVSTLGAVRMVPWAKTNINYTGQALIISAATIATYFIVTEQTILECSRQGAYDAVEKSRAGVS